jgi:hypothetical protein
MSPFVQKTKYGGVLQHPAVFCCGKSNSLKMLLGTKKIACLLAYLCAGLTAFSQSFQPSPDPLLTQQIALEQANECLLYFDYPTDDTLRLQWRKIETNVPDGWDIDLCDYGACYIGIPANGLMSAAFGGDRPYLKLIVQPEAVEGAAWLWFRVNELGSPTPFVDVFFNLHTAGVSSVTAPPVRDLRVSPNPARDFLSIENQLFETISARLSNALGHLFWAGELPPSSVFSVNVQDFPAGMYFLQIPDKTHKVLIQK